MFSQWLLVIPFGFLFRALYYEKRFAYLSSVHKIHGQYLDILAKKSNNAKDKETQGMLYRGLLEKQEIVKRYISEAGMENPKITRVKPLGLGAVETPSYSVLDNITQNNLEFADLFNQCIQSAMGYYKYFRDESLNPLYWPEYIVLKLPKSVISKMIEIVKSSFH